MVSLKKSEFFNTTEIFLSNIILLNYIIYFLQNIVVLTFSELPSISLFLWNL